MRARFTASRKYRNKFQSRAFSFAGSRYHQIALSRRHISGVTLPTMEAGAATTVYLNQLSLSPNSSHLESRHLVVFSLLAGKNRASGTTWTPTENSWLYRRHLQCGRGTSRTALALATTTPRTRVGGLGLAPRSSQKGRERRYSMENVRRRNDDRYVEGPEVRLYRVDSQEEYTWLLGIRNDTAPVIFVRPTRVPGSM